MAMMSLTSPALAEDVSTFALKNGLQVVVIEDHRAPVVVHMVWYKIGAADESPGHSGIAHFLEHLMFQGTKTVPPEQFSKIVAARTGEVAMARVIQANPGHRATRSFAATSASVLRTSWPSPSKVELTVPSDAAGGVSGRSSAIV